MSFSRKDPVSVSCRTVKTAKDMQAVLDRIKSNESENKVIVTELDLTLSPLTLEAAEVLGKFLAKNTTLQSLNLRSALPKPDDKKDHSIFAAIATGLALNKSILRLNLEWNDLDPEDFKILGNLLQHNSTIQALELEGNCLPNKMTALITSPALNELHISHPTEKTPLDGSGAALLISTNPSLVILNLAGHQLGNKHLPNLTHAIQNSSLITLFLSECQLENAGEEDICNLLNVLMTHQSLQTLHLANNKFSPAQLKLITNKLNPSSDESKNSHSTIKSLVLDSCFELSSQNTRNTRLIIKSLTRLASSSLHSLSLSNIGLSDKNNLNEFWTTLANNSTLEKLNLSNNQFSNKTIKKIEKLFNSHSLQTLDLSNNLGISFEGVETMALTLAENKGCQLNNLSLKQCNIGTDYNPESKTLSIFNNVKSLRQLDLRDNNINNGKLLDGLKKNAYLTLCLFKSDYISRTKNTAADNDDFIQTGKNSLTHQRVDLNWLRICVLIASYRANKGSYIASSILSLIQLIAEFQKPVYIDEFEPLRQTPTRNGF